LLVEEEKTTGAISETELLIPNVFLFMEVGIC
jgi:hypothetical protein